jgi:hypothetical protein
MIRRAQFRQNSQALGLSSLTLTSHSAFGLEADPLRVKSRHDGVLRNVCSSPDCVEEVGDPTVRDGARRQTRVSLFVLRQAMERAAGSALPAFGGSGLW